MASPLINSDQIGQIDDGPSSRAAGAVEGFTLCSLFQVGMPSPAINHETPDPECDLDYVPNHARRKDIEVALSNSFGFGGTNACVIFRKAAAAATSTR